MILEEMKTKLLKKAQRKLSNSYPDYEYDTDLLGDYFDDALNIIKDWKKLSEINEPILNGKYDTEIVQFIIESIVISGMEGQSQNYSNGIKKIFYGDPKSNLQSSIPQSL